MPIASAEGPRDLLEELERVLEAGLHPFAMPLGLGRATHGYRPAGMLVAVTDHAAERFRQRVRGSLSEKTEVASRVAKAYAAERVIDGERGTVLVRDLERPDVVYVCRPEGEELVVVTLWEEGENAQVPRRFTDALRRDDHRVR